MPVLPVFLFLGSCLTKWFTSSTALKSSPPLPLRAPHCNQPCFGSCPSPTCIPSNPHRAHPTSLLTSSKPPFPTRMILLAKCKTGHAPLLLPTLLRVMPSDHQLFCYRWTQERLERRLRIDESLDSSREVCPRAECNSAGTSSCGHCSSRTTDSR